MGRPAPTSRLARLALLVAITAAGCNIVGPAAYIIAGPETVPAQYELADVPTVVFIDDRTNLIDRAGAINPRQIRQRIGAKASEDLMIKELVTTTISPRDATAYALQQDRSDKLLPIDAIGRAVGADQVIYVEMLQFAASPDGHTPRPVAACRVRVLDVVNRKRLFPPPESKETAVIVQPAFPTVLPEVYQSNSSRVQLFQLMAEELGAQIAKVFYEHERKELGGNLNPR